MNKSCPWAAKLLRQLAETYGTPLFVYDEAGIRAHARQLKQAFAWSAGYLNYFAVKATPTPEILRLLADEGLGFDCSSEVELELAEPTQAKLFYTSSNSSDQAYQQAARLGAIINLDKLAYLAQLKRALGKLPETVALRYVPTITKFGNQIIGQPTNSKFGDTQAHILTGIAELKAAGVQQIGLQAMLVSNESRPQVFGQIAQFMRQLAEAIEARYHFKVAFINLGGGLAVNYQPDQAPTDIQAIGQAVKAVLAPTQIPIITEIGRYLTGPNGYLLTRVNHQPVKSHQTFLPVDTSVNNLNRLISVEGAYHQLEAVGKAAKPSQMTTVVGSMCTNNDQLFAGQLPTNLQAGDLLVIYDVGAHGRSDSTNYNGQLRAGEVLVRPDGSHLLIRRHESRADLLATTKGL